MLENAKKTREVGKRERDRKAREREQEHPMRTIESYKNKRKKDMKTRERREQVREKINKEKR